MKFADVVSRFPKDVNPLKAKTPFTNIKLGKGQITVHDYLAYVHEGLIRGYKFNRSDGSVAVATVKRVRNDLHPPSLGQFPFVLTRDTDGKLIGELTDAHSRTAGLHLRYTDGTVDPKALSQMTISYAANPPEEKMTIYKNCNANKGHVSSDKYGNPYYALGDIVKQIYDKEARCEKGLTRKHTPALIYATIAHLDPDVDTSEGFDFADVFLLRSYVKTRYSDVLKGDLPFEVDIEKLEDIVNAVSFYFDVQNHFVAECTDKSAKKKVLESGPLLGIILADSLFNGGTIGDSARHVSNRIIKSASTLSRVLPTITGSDRIAIRSNSQDVLKILKGKNKIG